MTARFLVLVVAFAITCDAEIPFRDPIYRETEVRHARPRLSGEKFDRHETDPKLRAAFAAADAAAERRVANVKRDERFALKFWSAKKQILRRQFGIDWKSPAELNPTLAYDSYGQPRLPQPRFERSCLSFADISVTRLRKSRRSSVLLKAPSKFGRCSKALRVLISMSYPGMTGIGHSLTPPCAALTFVSKTSDQPLQPN
jgi:hypothetical protein